MQSKTGLNCIQTLVAMTASCYSKENKIRKKSPNPDTVITLIFAPGIPADSPAPPPRPPPPGNHCRAPSSPQHSTSIPLLSNQITTFIWKVTHWSKTLPHLSNQLSNLPGSSTVCQCTPMNVSYSEPSFPLEGGQSPEKYNHLKGVGCVHRAGIGCVHLAGLHQQNLKY